MQLADTDWPSLSADAWPDTCATLHMWFQVVGKIRLGLTPRLNHWWNAALYVTARGFTTSPMPYDGRALEISFDFLDHELRFETSDGGRRVLALVPQSVADFYATVMDTLADLDMPVRIWPMPVEIPSPIRFDRDGQHASYDRASAHAWWRLQVTLVDVFSEFRARFIGKSSPVHFWWGSFDLAVTRFNGRRAPERPNADAMMREAYSHEVISAGFWPAGGKDPAFYAYAAPEPPGFKTARILPVASFYSTDLGEYILKYEDVRGAASPREDLLAFLQTTYEAGAALAGWDRRELER